MKNLLKNKWFWIVVLIVAILLVWFFKSRADKKKRELEQKKSQHTPKVTVSEVKQKKSTEGSPVVGQTKPSAK
jgi:YbbR domain-containing protein